MAECRECRCGRERDETDLYAELESILAANEGDSGALIQVLHRVQDLFGYVPQRAQRLIARALALTEADVEGVVSFYHYFTRQPRGKHTVRVCLGTACYVRGGRKLVDELQKTLEVEVGSTTADSEFTLETVRCIGACGLSPVMTVDDDVYRRVSPARASRLVTGRRSEDSPDPASSE